MGAATCRWLEAASGHVEGVSSSMAMGFEGWQFKLEFRDMSENP